MAYAVSRARFRELHDASQRILLQTIIQRLLPGARDIGYSVIQRAKAAALTADPRRLSLLDTLELFQAGPEVVIGSPDHDWAFPQYPLYSSDAVENVYLVDKPSGEIKLEGGWRLAYESKTADSGMQVLSSLPMHSRHEVVFAAGPCALPLCFRTREPGDRMQIGPAGSSAKIKDILIEARIPAVLRSRWPLLADQQKVLWIPGVRRSTSAEVSKDTQRFVCCRLEHPVVELLEKIGSAANFESEGGGLNTGNRIRDIALVMLQGKTYREAALKLSIPEAAFTGFIRNWENSTSCCITSSCTPDGNKSERLSAFGFQLLQQICRLFS